MIKAIPLFYQCWSDLSKIIERPGEQDLLLIELKLLDIGSSQIDFHCVNDESNLDVDLSLGHSRPLGEEC